jgi:hypothetical protein
MAENFTPVVIAPTSLQSAVGAINSNFSSLSSMLQDVLSRTGISPNSMSSSLDMNSNRIINLPSPQALSEPVRFQDILNLQPSFFPFINVNQDNSPSVLTPIQTSFNTSYSFNSIYMPNTDGLNTSGQTTQQTNLLTLNLSCGNTTSTSNAAFVTLNAILNFNKPTANPTGNYSVASFYGTASCPDGVAGSGHPVLFGINPNISLGHTATNWSLVGAELDLSVLSPTTATDVVGTQIVLTPGHYAQGSRANLGLSFNNAAGVTAGWDVGLCFGSYSGFNPMFSTGTLIGTMQHGVSLGYNVPASMGTISYGMDISGYTFTGAPLVAQLQTPSSSSATGKQGSLCWDANYVYVCTATNTWKRATLNTF